MKNLLDDRTLNMASTPSRMVLLTLRAGSSSPTEGLP
jgi:hypothetical protein